MKAIVLQENFLKGLSLVSRAVSSKSQLPVLSNILITTEKGQLKLSATNLETGINYWLGAKIEKEGAICVSAKNLTEFVSFLPPEKIELEVKENSLSLKSGNYSASFVGLSPSEFPLLPTVDLKGIFSFDYQKMAEAINQLFFAASTDESRPVLTGILFQIKDGDLILVATDGYRLSFKKIEKLKGLEKLKEIKEKIIIPAKSLVEVIRVLEEEKEGKINLDLISSSTQVVFSSAHAQVISRLIEGDFPDFERIIPSSYNTKIILEKEDFLRAVRSAAIFARESANVVKLKIKKGELKISANAPQVGENLVNLEVSQEGEDNNIAFNVRYLLDFLNSTSAKKIVFETSGALNPGVFKPEDDSSYLHLIMPVRVQE
ncbi:MAG: DNA polymerase III subunit beta [Microgenomates group bacterium]